MAAEAPTIAWSFVLEQADGWLLYLFVAAAVAAAWWSWRQYGPAPAGFAGGLVRCCRMLALWAIIAGLAGPAWRQDERLRQPGRIAVLIDCSLSMARPDGPGQQPRQAVVADLKAALAQRGDHDAQVTWFRVGSRPGPLAEELVADGESSPLGTDLEQVLFNAGPDLAIVVSDGRVTAGPSLEQVARDLERRGLPAHGFQVLAVGGESLEPELTIEEVDGPRTLAIGERVDFVLKASGRALGSGKLRVVLYDGDRQVEERELPLEAPRDAATVLDLSAELGGVLDREGSHTLRFVIERPDDPRLRREATVGVEVQRRKLTVLLLEGLPRWETRYLREALERDHTVTVHAYLADDRWRAWLNRDAPPGPAFNRGSLATYDCIIIGDLHPSLIPEDAQEAIRRAVNEDGAGLLWMPGPQGDLPAFANGPLGKLIPARLPPVKAIVEGYRLNRTLRPARSPAARAENLLMSEGRPWEQLLLNERHCPIEEIRMGARVLFTGTDPDGREVPLVIDRGEGAGRVCLVATDDTWSWRKDAGDRYLHAFHNQLLRLLAAGRVLGGKAWSFTTFPRRVGSGAQLQVALNRKAGVTDTAPLPETVVIELIGPDGKGHLRTLRRVGDEAAYSLTLTATTPGAWAIRLQDGHGLDESSAGRGEFTVLAPADETRDPRRDLTALRALARHGRLVDGQTAGAAADLVARLPTLARQRTRTLLSPVWDTWWSLLAVTLFFAIEWATRRACRLP